MDLARWQTSPLFIAVREILNGKDQPFRYRLEAIIHTKDKDYKVFKVLSETIIRDYTKNMMDDTMITLHVPLGDYQYLIYPNKDNLELTVKKTSLDSISGEVSYNKPIEEIRYKCLFDSTNISYAATEYSAADQNSLNLSKFTSFRVRLMDRNAEPLRVKMVQGVFRGVTPADLMKSILLGESQKVLIDGKPSVTGLDLVKPDNQKPIQQVVIPSGTYICEIPTILQEEYTGVYKYGIGTYYQRYGKNQTPTWFIYPLYDFSRFDNGDHKDLAIFYAAPPKYTKHVERTYRVQSGVVQIIVTTSRYQVNVSDIVQLDKGVGFRLPDVNAFMKKPVKIENGQAFAARGNLNMEAGYIDRGDGLNHVPMIMDYSTNPYNELSKVSSRQISVLQFGWQNADESLLYPGMPCKYIFIQDDRVCEIRGTILGLQSYRVKEGSMVDYDRYSTNCVVVVATELSTKIPEFSNDVSLDPKA